MKKSKALKGKKKQKIEKSLEGLKAKNTSNVDSPSFVFTYSSEIQQKFNNLKVQFKFQKRKKYFCPGNLLENEVKIPCVDNIYSNLLFDRKWKVLLWKQRMDNKEDKNGALVMLLGQNKLLDTWDIDKIEKELLELELHNPKLTFNPFRKCAPTFSLMSLISQIHESEIKKKNSKENEVKNETNLIMSKPKNKISKNIKKASKKPKK